MPDFRETMQPVLMNKNVSNVNPVTQASAASLANVITHFITKISGTAAMTGFRLPAGFKGHFAVIPTAASTGVTGGTFADAGGDTYDVPIGLAFTNVINRVQLFYCDGLLVYPSYVS